MTNSTSTGQLIKLALRPARAVMFEKDKKRDRKEVSLGVRRHIGSAIKGESPWPLFFYGPAGRGKTCAALALLDWLFLPYRYYTVKSLRDVLIAAMQGKETREYPYGVHEADIWNGIKHANIVVLDEVGVSQTVTDHHYDAVCGVLDRREGKPLVAISNLSPQDIGSIYDERIKSRMCCGTLVDFSGYPDRRLGKLQGLGEGG